MSITEILLIAFALALDAFAVALGAGSYFGRATARQKFRLSFHFGLFQFLMPIVGWLLGYELVKMFESYDYWIAFAVLAATGVKMIHSSFRAADEPVLRDMSRGWSLVMLSLATSIDALAVGFSIGIIQGKILFPSFVIGIVAAGMTLAGLKSGEKLSAYLGSKVEIIAGLVIIAIGIKIVFDHLSLN